MNAYAAWTHHDWVRHYAGDRGVGVLTTQGAFENPRLHGRVVHSFSVGPRGVAGVGAVDLGTIATTDRITARSHASTRSGRASRMTKPRA